MLKLIPLEKNFPGGGQGRLPGYSSLLCDKLSSSFGLQLVFHFKDNKPPYGYTLLDHSGKNVFKGSEIMALGRFMETLSSAQTKRIARENQDVKIVSSRSHFAPDEAMLLSNPGGMKLNDWQGGHENRFSLWDFSLNLDISDDIDDEQIPGRNRRRQKKAGANTC